MEKQVNLTAEQAKIQLVNANVTHCLWPRGEGKTSSIGMRLMHLNRVMPRSQIILASDTKVRIEGTIIGNITSFMSNEMGMVEEVDFVVFKKPPEHFVKPFIIPRKFDNVVSFKDGLCLCCGATFTDGSFNGFNAQAAIIDETKFVNQGRIKSQLLKALRGLHKLYGHLPEYRSLWTFSDKYEGDVTWILQMRDQQNIELIDAIAMVALDIEDKRNALTEKINSGYEESYIYRLKKEIALAEMELNKIRKELVYVSEAKPFGNLDNLGQKFYDDARRDCKSITEYNIAILNQDPNKSEHPYYPDLTDDNKYNVDDHADRDESKPLLVTADYNWRIVSICAGQLAKLPQQENPSLNTIASCHALAPAGIEDAVKQFTDMFTGRINRRIVFGFDNTDIARDPGRDSLKDITIKLLKKHGWKVKSVYLRQLSDHDTRYQSSKKYLSGTAKFRCYFNEQYAAPTIKSMEKATAITSSGKTKKDKRDESNPNIPAETTTHHSEAWDKLAHMAFEFTNQLNFSGSSVAVLGTN